MGDKEPRKHIKARYAELLQAQAAQIKVLQASDFVANHCDEEADL